MNSSIDCRRQTRVSVARHPDLREYRQPEVGALVGRALGGLGLESDLPDGPVRNPLRQVVAPGARIVLKPNWVFHANEGPGGTDCLITQAKVLQSVLEYVWRTDPRSVVVGDAPVQGCDFEALLDLGFRDVARACAASTPPLLVKDFRRTILRRQTQKIVVEEECRPESEFVLVDLGEHSLLEPISADHRRFRVTMYDPRQLARNHRPGLHRYLIARDVLEADLVINLPKLKTHKKAGITAALKNLVGINGNKDYLPHHRKGAANRGGDNYAVSTPAKRLTEEVLDWANRCRHRPRVYGALLGVADRLLTLERRHGRPADIEGGWHGNDTVWRMCLDLNKALLYSDAAGRLHPHPQRVILTVSDGIVAGEANGPLRPEPRPAGVVMAALNPAAHDHVAALLMGFQPSAIPIVHHAFAAASFPLTSFPAEDITCTLDGWTIPPDQLPNLHFRPPDGWLGHCERQETLR